MLPPGQEVPTPHPHPPSVGTRRGGGAPGTRRGGGALGTQPWARGGGALGAQRRGSQVGTVRKLLAGSHRLIFWLRLLRIKCEYIIVIGIRHRPCIPASSSLLPSLAIGESSRIQHPKTAHGNVANISLNIQFKEYILPCGRIRIQVDLSLSILVL